MTDFINTLIRLPALLVWLILAAASAIEYVFPPFPGDAIVLGGGVLVGGSGTSVVPVVLAVTAGSVIGAWADYELGLWLGRPGTSWLHRWVGRPKVTAGVEKVRAGFSKHGDLYLVINRFLPGIRAFFFIAAGLSKIPRRRVLALATVAALMWNALLVAVGLSVGRNLDRLLEFLGTYSRFAWILIGVVSAALLTRFWIRSRRAKTDAEDNQESV